MERALSAGKQVVFSTGRNISIVKPYMYLSGEFGPHPDDVNAYTASIFYAVDRFASFRSDWGEVYRNGGLILSDRYTTSNAVHQGAKLPEDELPDFFRWLEDIEYGKMGLPRPDLVIYLDVDLELSLMRMKLPFACERLSIVRKIKNA